MAMPNSVRRSTSRHKPQFHFHQVASSTHQQLWPRALSEVRLHDEPAVSFACDFSFDVVTPYLPSVVQGAINRWRDESMLPGCDSQKASDVARTQFDRAVGTDAIRLGKITIANPERGRSSFSSDLAPSGPCGPCRQDVERKSGGRKEEEEEQQGDEEGETYH